MILVGPGPEEADAREQIIRFVFLQFQLTVCYLNQNTAELVAKTHFSYRIPLSAKQEHGAGEAGTSKVNAFVVY